MKCVPGVVSDPFVSRKNKKLCCVPLKKKKFIAKQFYFLH